MVCVVCESVFIYQVEQNSCHIDLSPIVLDDHKTVFNNYVPTWHSLCVVTPIAVTASVKSRKIPVFLSVHFISIRNFTTAMLYGWSSLISSHSLTEIPRCITSSRIISVSNWPENRSISELLGFWPNASSLRPEIIIWKLEADTNLHH